MSEQQKYNVVYAGAIAQGFDEEQVKRGFVYQMKIPADKVDQLLSGNRMTLKKSVSKPKAELWQKKLLSIGAETAIVPFVATEITAKKTSAKPTTPVRPPIERPKTHQVSSQEEYDEEMEEKIRKAKTMIAMQQMEQFGQKKEASPVKKLLVFSGVLAILVFFLYFYVDSMI